jgi:hypothetical protein
MALIIFAALAIQSLNVVANNWNAAQFKSEIGNVLSTKDAFSLTSNESGQILVSVPVNKLSLDDNNRVSFKFAGQPPAQIFIIWRNNRSQELRQKGFRSMEKSNPSIDMTGITGWSGSASSMEFGFLTRPGQQINLLEARIFRPGMTDYIYGTLENWSSFRPWEPVDVNVYTGTNEFNKGPYPAPIFAGVTLAFILLYWLLRRKKASYQGGAIIIFCSWLTLDSLWQWQLWRQLIETRAQYGGLSSQEKLLASDDAVFFTFVDTAKGVMKQTDARVFIAGSNDYQTMVSAYFMAPRNTFLHRGGPELPKAKYLQRGDYILLLRASELHYQSTAGLIHFPDGQQIQVREHLSDRIGSLLEVL